MTNLHAVKIFTESLKELTGENLTLFQSLKIISNSKVTNRKIRNGAENIASAVERGTLFSNALKTCPYIRFDPVYTSFLSFAEKNGNLAETLKFLCERARRLEENRNSLAGALIYPLFVVFLVLVISIMFLCSDSLLPMGTVVFGIDEKKAFESVVFSFMTFLCLASALVYMVFRFMGEDKLYEAFLAGGFLSKNGISLAHACSMASVILGIDSKSGIVFQKAREGLEYGMDLRTAFSRGKNNKLQKKIEMALLVSEETGNKDEVFLKIADNLKRDNEKNRKYCMTLIEPAFIVLTGVFVMGIVINVILPVFSETGIL